MDEKWALFLILISNIIYGQPNKPFVREIDNIIFRQDPWWRGADGAATVAIGQDKVLWLFSDTFIDQDGTGKRSNSRMMIRNSIAIQDSASMGDPLKFQYGGSKSNPKDFFQHPAENWFWTGHGVFANEKLIVFLIEEHSIESDPGFEACGWYIAIIDNSGEIPDKWNIDYIKGPDTDGIIIGSSAVLKDERFIYAFGVREPATHESYLVRFPIDKLTEGSFADMQWMENNQWKNQLPANRTAASLFIGQTEFSVHYDPKLQKFIQIQTLGYGRASIAYRLADQLHGPWSGPEIIYTPALEDGSEYIYTANAHPEFGTDEIIVTYNVNSSAFETLKMNEEIYFPRILRLEFRK